MSYKIRNCFISSLLAATFSVGFAQTTPQINEFNATTAPATFANGGANGIAAGPDGNIWFVETNSDKIIRVSQDGATASEFHIPTVTGVPGDRRPWGIVAGPDGNLWFTERAAHKIGQAAFDPTLWLMSLGALFYLRRRKAKGQ
jgi:streptogramin lyase